MSNLDLFGDALKIASAVLAKKSREDSQTWAAKSLSSTRDFQLFWWSKEIALVEIPLTNDLNALSGYFLISTDRRLPPLLEYSSSAPPLSRQIHEGHEQTLIDEGFSLKNSKLLY